MEKKGLTAAEIDEAFRRLPDNLQGDKQIPLEIVVRQLIVVAGQCCNPTAYLTFQIPPFVIHNIEQDIWPLSAVNSEANDSKCLFVFKDKSTCVTLLCATHLMSCVIYKT